MSATDRESGSTPLRALPSVDSLLHQPAIARLLDEHPRSEVLHAIRAILDERRDVLRAGGQPALDVPSLALAVRLKLQQRALPHLRRVINATGIVLHTGLGRAPLATEAVDAIAELAGGYANLELDLDSGRRGDRHEHVRDLLRELTGAEDAFVVNNNAAATFLALSALAGGREVVVSRGQLVEIGGSYRMPDIMAAAGCHMVEVGTTNRTHLYDYERALSERTAVLLRVHTSNYRVCGFVESVALSELVGLARQRGLVTVDDLGSGLLNRDWPWPGTGADGPGPVPGTPGAAIEEPAPAPAAATDTAAPPPARWDEPTVQESLAAGADVVLFSGDKLLGGPQAGIAVGRAELIAHLRRSPLARVVRPGKLTLAALEATLRLYRDPATLLERLPVLRLLALPTGSLERAAVHLEHLVSHALDGAAVHSQADVSEAGGGSLPTIAFPTWTVHVRHPRLASPDLATALRQRDLPVICRLQDEALVFDCRTLLADDAEQIAAALSEVVRELSDA